MSAAWELQQRQRKAVRVQEANARRDARAFTATQAMIYAARNGLGSPAHRMVDSYLATWFSPITGNSIHVQRFRIADALGITEAEVAELVPSLALHASHESVLSEALMPFRPEVHEAIHKFSQGEGRRLDWKTQNSPVKYASRYCPEEDAAAQFANVVLSAGQHHTHATEVRYTSAEFAALVGVSVEETFALLLPLAARGWEIIWDGKTYVFLPSAKLVARWAAFQKNCLENAVVTETDAYGVVRSQTMKSGQRESKWENDVWRPRMGLPAITNYLTVDKRMKNPAMDEAPQDGYWHLYEISDAQSGLVYIGITTKTLRQRLSQHIQREGSGLLTESNPGMATWIQALSDAGRTPTIRLVSTTGPCTRHEAETLEHALVVAACAAIGSSKVLNREHNNEEHPNFADMCNQHA